MWGNIAVETITQVNFGIGFSNTKSDVLIHLSQWQYWWWFWFSYLWSFYYLLILRVVRFRTLKFRPRLATTFRPHGKWGDLIVCLIPISWCANIISNSNFILRMIEWQAESSLFTIRIRGKQWYWVYKFELKTLTDILTAPKNIGRNKWRITTPGDLQSADDYLHILQLRSQNKWVQKYWVKEFPKNTRTKKFHVDNTQQLLSQNFVVRAQKLKRTSNVQYSSLTLINKPLKDCNWTYFNSFKKTAPRKLLSVDFLDMYNVKIDNKKKTWISDITLFDGKKNTVFNKELLCEGRRVQRTVRIDIFDNFWGKVFNNNVTHNNDFIEDARWMRRGQGSNSPIKFLKLPLSEKVDFNFNGDLFEVFRVRFNEPESTIKQKPTPHSTFWSMKQKRYKRRKIISPRYKFLREESGKLSKTPKYVGNPNLLNNNVLVENDFNATSQYNFLKKKKKRYENLSVVLSRRMLRTKRTLVLPAHVNITAVTNSYDVIHSWFIPGLGLKMDCIPGRATHHTFYIDNVGFYYGQCAEVCGRFHHHMPIRICALPFEHFLIWWHSFGLPKLLFTAPNKNLQTYYGFRKFVW